MFALKNFKTQSKDKKILNGINLQIQSGEIHILMGPNGSGKSTLCQALLGNPEYKSSGSATWNDEDLLSLSPDQRAKSGMFLSFQDPPEIEGVELESLLYQISDNMDPDILSQSVKKNLGRLGLPEEFAKRFLHQDASGGEKKRLEMLQLLEMNPKLAILDEIDSGLDVDSLKTIAEIIKELQNTGTSFLIVTHYERLLEYIEPDQIHIIKDGKIVKSGNKDLAENIEKHGYKNL